MKKWFLMRKSIFFLIMKIIRNMVLGKRTVFSALREVKWCVRAILGLQARPITKNLFGQSLIRHSEGIVPIETFGPGRNERLSLTFQACRKLGLSGTATPIYINMGNH